ncbi:hypothetical protein HBA54_19240 [Pelagibius litoralis]|uniref:Uncharacterized protein n=1 Tax=Pelagibius litoralis TaxID=374515 RepID=A0A967K903_9PROT|nr:hypothetical protein [Pelagibius litoralis]NIA70738.1 hypothetical protein [Pelagibius litoralis]
MTTTSQLEPCPFCRADLGLEAVPENHWKHPYNGCVLEGHSVTYDEETAWNTRSNSTSDAAVPRQPATPGISGASQQAAVDSGKLRGSMDLQPADSSGFAATPEQAEAMADAIWQLLDDMQFQDIGGYVCGGAIQQAKEAIEPFADNLELEPHERAKPYGGYAAGVAKCVEEIKEQLAKQRAFRTSKHAQGNAGKVHTATVAILTLEELLENLLILSPAPQPDTGLVEAVEKALKHADGNGMQGWPVFVALRKALQAQEKQP